jgi:hypothetical protein
MNDSIKREQSEFACSADRENLRPEGKKIINPWRNHEGYNCFGCSPDNPIGPPTDMVIDEKISKMLTFERAKI